MPRHMTLPWLKIMTFAAVWLCATVAAVAASNQQRNAPSVGSPQYKIITSPGIAGSSISIDQTSADQNSHATPNVGALPIRLVSAGICYLESVVPDFISMCGIAVPVPGLTDDTRKTGAVTITMPPPFAPGQKIIMQCFLNPNVPFKNGSQQSEYRLTVTDSSSVTCASASDVEQTK